MDGEEHGKKMSPEQAVQHIREFKLLPVKDYVTAKQARSLFTS